MAHRFIIVGNDFLPVNSHPERQLAARALQKTGILCAQIFTGAHTNCDPTGSSLHDDGQVLRDLRHARGEHEF